MTQKPVLRGEVGCACVAREVSVGRVGMGERGCARQKLKRPIRCRATHYCGQACQTAHWWAGQEQFCMTPEERAPQPASALPTHMQPLEEDLRLV